MANDQYPASPELIHKYASSVFSALARGECVSTVWVPMAGRRLVNKFIIENVDLFSKEVPNPDLYLFVYLEPLELTEESIAGYLRLMGKTFLETCKKNPKCKDCFDFDQDQRSFDDSTPYPKLLESLKNCLRKAIDAGLEVVFFLGEFDELDKFANTIFYNNLKSLWDSLKPQIHYVFLVVQDLSSPLLTARFGELNAATLENIVYVPIDNNTDIDYLINRFSNKYEHKLSDQEKQLIAQLCGGHPYLIKAAVRIIASLDSKKSSEDDLKQILLGHYELLSVSQRIFNLRTDEEKTLIRKVASGQSVISSPPMQHLIKLGLVVKTEEGKYRLFGELFAKVAGHDATEPQNNKPVSNLEDDHQLALNAAGEIVGASGLPIEEKFTRQEYELVSFLLKNQGKLVSRETISEILWGSESYDKYSDWAIDQIMSKIRKKLKSLSSRVNLVTVRGRGYKFLMS